MNIAAARPRNKERSMSSEQRYFAGIDWARQSHHVCIIDNDGQAVAERIFAHSGEGFRQMTAWLLERTGSSPDAVRIAIEVPHGPLVEFLIERGFAVFAINPKKLDRFRERFSLAGAKGDSLDCRVMSSALRTDAYAFRKIEIADPALVELREWSRLRDELVADRTRLINRLHEQLWRYYPAFLQLDDDPGSEWMLDLWSAAPTPKKGAKLNKATTTAILKRHRIRRLDADKIKAILSQPPIPVMPGTLDAVCDHIGTLIPRIRLLNAQIKRAHQKFDTLIEQLSTPAETEPGQPPEHRDATILASLPGHGRIVITTMLAEAWQPLAERNYQALRCITGVAPVTRQSGNTRYAIRRTAFNPRLANAVYHWARTAVQNDPICKQKYAALRARGKGHARALRSIADRLLFVACTLLKSRTLFRSTKPQIALAKG
jgi:transposase